MNDNTLKKIVALGALTGIRSMAGAATLAWGRSGTARLGRHHSQAAVIRR